MFDKRQYPGQGALDQDAPQPSAFRPVRPASGRRAAKLPGGRHSPDPEKKIKGGPWRIVFWAALTVFVVALLVLGAIALSYWQGQQAYKDVAKQAFTPPDDLEGTQLSDLKVDWNALKAINPDTVGWIYIPDTVVNYPIVHTTDNETYLTHDFRGSTGWIASFGAIFLSAENSPDFSDANNIVYGHHLNDGSMFACLVDFADEAQFNSHRTVYILTPQGNYRLKTFSLLHVAADDPLAQTGFASEDKRVSYVQDKIDRSVVKVPDIPKASDMKQTFAFATCDNLPSDGRYVLYAYIDETTVSTAHSISDPGSSVPVAPGVPPDIDSAAKKIGS